MTKQKMIGIVAFPPYFTVVYGLRKERERAGIVRKRSIRSSIC